MGVAGGQPSDFSHEQRISEQAGGIAHPVTETRDRFGSRLHLVHGMPEGPVEILYEASGVRAAEAPSSEEYDAVMHLRPSRYCEVDEFERIAAEIVAQFGAAPVVVATGGLAPLVVDSCRSIGEREPDLTVHGLRLAFERSQAR